MGDSIFGQVTAVQRADLVTFAHGAGTYNLRLVGITVPTDARSSTAATEFVRGLVLGRSARMRFEGRSRNGEMRARLFTADAPIGIREVSVELVRAGLVRKQAAVDFKYGELAAAEREARTARRGVWR
jgi:endonuclease YncB( thermonuclease family)